MKIYLAHPISGLSGKSVLDYYERLSKTLCEQYTVLCPMACKRYLYDVSECKPSGYKTAVSNDHAIFERDYWMVSQSDIVLCDFTGSEKVSIGCCMELAIAAYMRKHVVLVLPEGNIHKHSFVLEAADIIFPSLDDAVSYLRELAER